MNSKYYIDMIIRAKDEASAVFGKVKGEIEGMKPTIKNVASQAIELGKTFAVGAGLAAASLATFGIKSAISLEKTRVAFEVLYGSADKARKTLGDLAKFAASTPFELPELTDVALKLKNVAGIADKELIPTLRNLGDIASSQGKGITQIVEAYNDAIVGEYERLKEFGIKATTAGDKVTFSFKGQTKTVQKTSEAIGEYLKSVGQMDGIMGSMDKQSQTLDGRLSTIRDQFKGIAMAIVGVSQTGEIKEGGIFDRLSDAVARFGQFITDNEATIIKYAGTVSDVFGALFNGIKAIYDFFFNSTSSQWSGYFVGIAQIAQTYIGYITDFWKKYGEDIMLVLGTLFGRIVSTFGSTFTALMPIIKTGLTIIGEIFKVFSNILKGDWSAIFESLKTIGQLQMSLLGQVIKGALNIILGVFGTSLTEMGNKAKIAWSGIVDNAGEYIGRGLLAVITGGMSEILISWVGGRENMKSGMYAIVEPMVDRVGKQIDRVIGFVSRLKELWTQAKSMISDTVGGVGNIAGARAKGGPVSGGKTYLVGENGPELFTPSSGGNITPNNKLGGVQLSINVGSINNTTDLSRFEKLIEKTVIQAISNNQLGYV